MMANHVDPGTTTMARLPNELCIMILENLLPDDRDLYHQSMWRMRKANKILQRMRLVCKVWDVSTLHSYNDVVLKLIGN